MRRPLVRRLVVATMLLVLSPFLCIAVNLFGDLYRNGLVSIGCIHFSKLYWLSSIGIASTSHVCLETDDPYQAVAHWYEQRDWFCDGDCEYTREARIGPIEFYTFRYMDPFPEDIDTLQVPFRFDVYESFSISFAGD